MTGHSATSQDRFLGGALELLQPKSGYRAGTDPVFLAASVPAKSGETVLDIGCGVGVAALCLWHRTGAVLTGIEVQPDYVTLARKNAETTGAAFEVIQADLAALPPELRSRSFDHVMTNPPYFPASSGSASRDDGRELANREVIPLTAWMDAAIRRLAPRGTLTVIARTDRLPELLSAVSPRIGRVVVKPLASREGRSAKRVIIQGVKGVGTPLKLLSPLVLHTGPHHMADGDDYAAEAQGILRKGKDFSLG